MDTRNFSIQSWCREVGISPQTYFKEARAGRGPRVTRVGRRVIIVEAPKEYLGRREATLACVESEGQ